MSPAPRVSIGIPAYARPEELGQAIASVLGQDIQDVEVVVGDDSGDLEQVVRAVDDPRVRYFRNPRRLGMAGNWSAVLDRCRGELRGLLMDDDRLCPGFLGKVVDAFESDPSLGIVFTNHYFEDGERRWTRESPLPGGRHDDYVPLFLRYMPVAVSAAVMRREVWEQVRPLPDLQTSDVVMHLRAAQAGWPFFYVDEPLMVYRRHHGQLSSLMGFRDQGVGAWEMFEFDDPVAEGLRRGRLADALLARAAARLREGEHAGATEDVERAAQLSPGSPGIRGRAVRFLARHPSLSPAALELLRRTRLISSGP